MFVTPYTMQRLHRRQKNEAVRVLAAFFNHGYVNLRLGLRMDGYNGSYY